MVTSERSTGKWTSLQIEIKLFDEPCVSFNSQSCLEKIQVWRGVWMVKDALVLYINMEKKCTDISGVIPNFCFVQKSDSGCAGCGNPSLFCLPVIFTLHVMQVCSRAVPAASLSSAWEEPESPIAVLLRVRTFLVLTRQNRTDFLWWHFLMISD